MSDNDHFFEGKRPWSKIKDEVLGSYMSPYLAKVKNLKKPILLIDGYAGPGVFDDDSKGSPLIMCQAAEKYATGNYRAFFINKEKKHHEKLKDVINRANWQSSATPILGDTTKILPLLPSILKDQTVFLYLDPFGPTGCPFDLLEPFLTRKIEYSTEIILMMHMPVAHRLAARKAVEEGREYETPIQTHHSTMTKIFGGDYWKDIMFAPNISAEDREFRLIKAYKEKLVNYLPFIGSCPVREGSDHRIKYFIVFASRHPDAMLLMHNAMMKAYFKRMHEHDFAGTFFESSPWNELLPIKGLRDIIVEEIKKNPGLSRQELWLNIVQNNFMQYRESDYKTIVQGLIDEKVLICPTPRKTKRLNDVCQLFYSE